jgi:protein gp37
MAENSKIEWTDHTFNPWIGCTKISPACDNCYAEALSKRTGGSAYAAGAPRRLTSEANWQKPLAWNRKAAAEGRRYRVFSPSLADPFDAEVPDEWRFDHFSLMGATPHLDWLPLTKRAKLQREWFNDGHAHSAYNRGRAKADLPDIPAHTPLPNVWPGVTAENQKMADLRVPDLLRTRAVVRFLSGEPLLGPMELTSLTLNGDSEMNALQPAFWGDEIQRWKESGDREWLENFLDWYSLATPPTGQMHPTLDWVIVGGESGPGARPMHPDWARSLRDQCQSAGVPFFFKQWGEWREFDTGSPAVEVVEAVKEADLSLDPTAIGAIKPAFITPDGRLFKRFDHLPEDTPGRLIERVGKVRAGHLLDGRTWDEFPAVRHAG